MYDKNTSPVGWYVGSYLLRFVEDNDPMKNDLESKFISWENTVLVKASNLNEAHDKVVLLAKKSERSFKAGPDGVDAQWKFEGLTELLPIYEKLEDGTEIIWAEHAPRKLKNLRKLVRKKK